MSSLEKEYRLDLEMLEEKFKSLGLRKLLPVEFKDAKEPGTYALVFYLERPIKIRNWVFTKGVYVYVGSAKKGLKTRLSRYLSVPAKKFWHIDFVLPYANILFAYVGNSISETELAKILSRYYPSIERFGNSDDKHSISHLFFVPPLHYIINSFYEEGIKRKAPVYNAITQIKDPFERFIFVFLSSRTKDEITFRVTKNFVSKFDSWDKIKKATVEEIESLIYGVAFYRQKSRNLKKISEMLHGKYVPSSYDELIKLPGVGRKIAKVFLADVFNSDVIGVDVHVHRISNRLSIINTKTEHESDIVLNLMIPSSLKQKFNISFVGYGQVVCLPKNPRCSECKIKEYCRAYAVLMQE